MNNGRTYFTDADYRTALALGISPDEASDLNSGKRSYSDIMAEHEPPDFDEFYDARAQARMVQDTHERGHPL